MLGVYSASFVPEERDDEEEDCYYEPGWCADAAAYASGSGGIDYRVVSQVLGSGVYIVQAAVSPGGSMP